MVSQREMARLDAERAPPAWLRQQLETEFFEPCPRHPTSASRATATRTAGCNFFCTHCTGRALCSGCLGDHEGHQLVQVADVEHLLNVSLVQTYRINGANAVFLNCRPMLGHGRPGASRCEECERGLQDATSCFCSLGCKAQGIEDKLEFNVSFAVSPKSVSLADESDDDDDNKNEADNDDGDDNDGDEDDDDDDDSDDVDDDSDDDDDLNNDSDDDDGDDDDDDDDGDDDDDDDDDDDSSHPTKDQKLRDNIIII